MSRALETSGGLDLPPGYRAVVLREHRDAFSHAQSIAGEDGAGTLVSVRRFDRVELAVVFEPEEPLVSARRVVFAVMNAAGDALAVHCPPEKPLVFNYPDSILLDGGIIGGVQLAWPPRAPDGEPPEWLVAGLQVRLAVPHTRTAGDRGHALDVRLDKGTSLELEGFELMDAGELTGSFARHLLLQVDRWQSQGFKPVGEQFLARLPEEKGVRRGIDGNGDLIIRRPLRGAEVERQLLLTALSAPQWLDPETGEPWL